jgi:hypothetical protein
MGKMIVGVFSWCLMACAQAGELGGQLSLFSSGKPMRATEAQEAVIYFRPDKPVVPQPSLDPIVMTTRRKQFVPRVLAIRAGEKVRFPNEDPILHNAFSSSADNSFDTGQYGRGEGKVHQFHKPGLVRVYCNVHHSMFGFILVLDTPFHARADVQGRFRMSGLPEGEGELVVYHDRAAPVRKRVIINKDSIAAVDLRLELNQRKIPQHKNKFGKPYARSSNANY